MTKDSTPTGSGVADDAPGTPADDEQTRTAQDPASADEHTDSDTGEPGAVNGAPEGEDGSSGSGLRIVLAEDEALIRMDLAEMLTESGHQIVGQAADGEQAVALVRDTSPDLVVMDIKMPGMDGISAAEQIGRDGLAPVVMLTAFSDKNLVERARDAGVMSYVVKPFSAADVLPAIDIARARWAERKALESEVADLGDRFETRKRVDRAKGLLMAQLKLSEPDAFRWIQKAAMDRRLSMREVADAVIAGMPGK